MITNFDRETAPLNEKEQKAATIIAFCLNKNHVGKDKVISADTICKALADQSEYFRVRTATGYKPYLNGARIRKIINRIRIEGAAPLLVSNSAGYYVSDNISEVRDYIRSLNERADAIKAVSMALTEQLKKRFAGSSIANMEIK